MANDVAQQLKGANIEGGPRGDQLQLLADLQQVNGGRYECLHRSGKHACIAGFSVVAEHHNTTRCHHNISASQAGTVSLFGF